MKTRKSTCIVQFALILSFACAGVTAVHAGEIQQPPAAQPVPAKIEIADGPFRPTWESLKQYKCPDWFRDAKLGMWAHWGPQSVPMAGDWYARAMYEQSQPAYAYHVAHYGHPSKFGYKDLVQLWKVENWDPDRLVALYKKAGARYFVAQANHHDNWDNWNSKYHRWNSVNVGPKKDIVGLWASAARKHGLPFGVSEHVARSYSWWHTNKGSDKDGPLAGVPYDGSDPAFQDLYFPPHNNLTYALPSNPPEWWPRQWFWRIRDLVDTYHPDLLYTDNGVPFGEVGRSLFAHYYNANMAWHSGKLEAVYNLKDYSRPDHGEYVDGIGVQDVERGMLRGIKLEPWQTDTCIGNWFYKTGFPYKPASQVICMLCDIVSKNGNLLLSIPLKPDGTLDAKEEKVLADLGAWMEVNGEAIYGTRPWKVFGEGPTVDSGHSGEDGQRYSDRDIRFTTKEDALYALVLGWPNGPKTTVRSLASGAGTITKVSLLGHSGELKWKQTADGLEVVLPAKRPSEHAFALKISGRQLRPMPLSPALAHYDAQGRIVLEARDAKIHGDTPRYELDGAKDQIGFWSNPKDYVSWTFEVLRPGSYDVAVTYSCATGSEGDEFVIESGDQELTGRSVATGSWFTYVTKNLGQLKFEKAGSCTIAVKPKSGPTWKTIGLQSVVMTPQAGLQPK
ncbi:MAG TPA: alpha-L-fucosidase [Thermoguttaceae bacterium]|nr:alpha-L-fucosidase [Thermoguttaceae bacterium]